MAIFQTFLSKNHPSPLSNFPFIESDPAKLLDEGEKWTRLYQEIISLSPR